MITTRAPDGANKIPNKKVKVGPAFHFRDFAIFNFNFNFQGILQSSTSTSTSTFKAGPVQKTTLYIKLVIILGKFLGNVSEDC